MSPRTLPTLVQALTTRPAHVALAALSAGLALSSVTPREAAPMLSTIAVAIVGALTVLARPRRRQPDPADGAMGGGTLVADGPAGAGRAVGFERRAATGGGAVVNGGAVGASRAVGIERRALEVAAFAALALAGGAALGHARLESIDRFQPLVRDGSPIAARAEMLAHPRAGPFGASVEVRVTTGRLRGARLLARLPLWAGSLDGVPIGSELRARGRLRSLDRIAVDDRGREFKVAAWLARERIAGELQLDAVKLTGSRRGGLPGVLDHVRDRAEGAVAAGLRGDQAALLRGMVLGQDEAIEKPVRDDFQASGLSHILAVSGQNVMLLAALALPALMAVGLGATGRAVALLALIALYVPLAGAGPSLQRAAIMGAAAIAAMVAARPASRSYALLLAAAATLLLNPRAIGDPGWQLSFVAVAGILLIGRPLAGTLREAIDAATRPRGAPGAPSEARGVHSHAGSAAHPAPSALASGSPSEARAVRTHAGRLVHAGVRALADGVAITVAATLATAPLLAHHFGTVSLASLPANVLALPAVAPAMWLGMLKAAAGQLSLAGIPGDAVAEVLGAAARLPLTLIATLADRFARLPFGQLRLPLRVPAEVALAYVALIAAVFAVRRIAPSLVAQSGEAGARWRRLSPPLRVGAVTAVVTIMTLVGVGQFAPAHPPDALTVRFLDVGQGDATLIQAPDGTAILFDGGPPEGGVARQLRHAGVRRLSLVVATHPSRDHHGGLPSVLTDFPVDLLLDGGDGTRDPTFRALEALADRLRIHRVAALAPMSLRAGPVRIRVLSPAPRPPGPPPEDPNPRAVTAIVSAGDFDLLLSGDAESPMLLTLPLPDVDAMKLPHHGSADAGLPELLTRLRPELAGITVGTNTYGHPAPSTLAALRHAGVPTWRTDEDGTVTITVAGGDMHVETHG